MPSQMSQMAAQAPTQLRMQQQAQAQLMAGQQPVMMVPMIPVATPMGYMAMGGGAMAVPMQMGMPMVNMNGMSPMGMGTGMQSPRIRLDSSMGRRTGENGGNRGQHQQQKRPGTIIS
jgi:hypothetical protein